MKIFIHTILVTAVLVFVADNIYAQKVSASEQTAKNTNTSFTCKIFKAFANTYGYDIYAHDKLLIHQPNIPAMPENKGFATKRDAAKVAELVIEKLKQNIMPPTINDKEITKTKVIP